MKRVDELILAVEVRSLRWLIVVMLTIVIALLLINISIHVYRTFVVEAQLSQAKEELHATNTRLLAERKNHGEL